MSDPKKPPQGHREAPPVYRELPDGVTQKGAASLYEPGFVQPVVGGGTVYDQPAFVMEVEDDDGEEEVPAVEPPVAPQERAVPAFQLRKKPGRDVPPEVLDPPRLIESGEVGPARGWTIDEAGPAPAAPPPRRKVVVVENPVGPEPSRKVTVHITSFGPASSDERAWVVGGDTGVRIVVPGDPEKGKSGRLVAAYLAFQVTDAVEDESGDREVTGIVRWFGLPEDREGMWDVKRKRGKAERTKQLEAALQYFFAFPDIQIGMAVQFLAGPVTDPAAMKRYGYQYHSGKSGDPGIKVLVNLVGTVAVFKEAARFFRETNPFWIPNFLQRNWPFVDTAAIQRYRLGRHVEEHGMPQLGGDGLAAVDRVGMLVRTAEMASLPVSSFARIAWQGDAGIEAAMSRREMPLINPTRLGTMYEEGGKVE